MRYAGEYRLIFMCWLLALHCLASNTHLQDFCTHQTVPWTICLFALVLALNTGWALHFFFSYAHKVIQTHPLSNLSIGTLWYKCTGEIFLEERSFIVGNSQLKKAARSQGRPLIPCKEALIPVLSQHLLIHCQTQFGVNKATHTHMLKIFCRA